MDVNALHLARSALDLLWICEEEVKAAGDPPGMFAALWPTDPVRGSERLYRAHVRELLRREARGENLDPATDAEVLGVLSGWSLQAPMVQELVAVYETVFSSLFPEDVPEGAQTPEAWPGQVEEILSQIRRRFQVERR